MNNSELVRLLKQKAEEQGIVQALYHVFRKNINVQIGFSEGDSASGIDALGLSVRSYNALCRAGIMTLGELIARLNEGTLKGIRNLGAKSYNEIQTKMMVYGFDRLSEREKNNFFLYLAENNTPKNE